MKKSIKALIAASAVAAVAGVGAVSYAAWAVNNKATTTQAGATGKILAVGSLATSGATGFDKLVPYDQQTKNGTDSAKYPYDASKMSLYGSVVLNYTANQSGDDYDLTYTIDKGDSTLTLEYAVGEASSYGSIAADAWTAIGASSSPTTMTGFTTGKTVYVRMTSEATTDMAKSFTLTFSVTASEKSST